MFETDQQLSSDLDWMLQSGQASHATLADALVNEYYPAVYRLALAYLENPYLAERAAIEVFSNALLNVYRYRSEVGVQAWVFGLALKIFTSWQRRIRPRRFITSSLRLARHTPGSSAPTPRDDIDAHLWLAVDSLSDVQRLPVLLRGLLGWSETEIARLLPDRENQVKANRDLIWITKELKLADQDLQARLSDSLQFRWPEPELTSQDLEQIMADILDQAGRQAARRRRFASFNEILLIGVAVLFAAGLFWGYNRLFPETEPLPVVHVPPSATAVTVASSTPSPTSTRTRRPSPTPVPSPTPFPSGVFYYVRPNDEIYTIARRLRIPVAELLNLNRLPVDAVLEVGQALLVPDDRLPTSTPAAVTPVIPPTSLPPLSAGSSPEEILQRSRFFGGAWSTVWFDVDLVLYGPAGYHGPSQEYRMQAWIGQQQFLVLLGLAGERPYQVLMSDKDSDSFYFSRPGRDRPWFIEPNWREAASEEGSSFMEIFLPFQVVFEEALAPANSSFDRVIPNVRVVGSEQISGRDALVVEHTDTDGQPQVLLWLDKSTGFPLRKQRFAQNQPGALLSESRVSAIAYNVDFPQELFDLRLPWRGGYAQDFTGQPFPASFQPTTWADLLEPTPLPTRQVPPDFDPASSRLVFQTTRQAFNFFEPAANVARTFVDLYADDYFLGHVEFPNPIFTICDRSPDGRRIAFAAKSFYSDFEYFSWQPPILRWIDLSDPAKVLHPPDAMEAYAFAFAPDSRRLAFFGKHPQEGERGIYILDTDSGTYQRILPAFVARSLVWSPDGEHLAFLLREGSAQGTEELIVKNVRTRETTNRLTYFPGRAIPTASPLPDWLASIWEKEFPSRMGDLDACSEPPG